MTALLGNKLALGLIAALALVLTGAGAYFKGRGDGKEAIRAQVAEASLKASEKSRAASDTATGNKGTRDQEFAESQAAIKEAVDEAIANDTNVFDAYFDSLRASQSGGSEAASE